VNNKTPIGKGKHDKAIMSFIDKYWASNFRPPSVREIMAACSVGSTSYVTYTLRRLAETDKYVFVPGDARGIVPAWVVNSIRVNAEAMKI
jgi:hypothetical protein